MLPGSSRARSTRQPRRTRRHNGCVTIYEHSMESYAQVAGKKVLTVLLETECRLQWWTSSKAIQDRRCMENVKQPEAIGPYRIRSQIGQGGMGTVLLAVHETLERPVALKILPHEFAANPEYVTRF